MLQAIMTALLSGLFSGAVMFSLNERRDRMTERLKKIEEAYLAVAQWCDNLGGLMTIVVRLQAKPLASVMDDVLANQNAGWDVRNRAMMMTRLWLADELQVIAVVDNAREKLTAHAMQLLDVARQRFLTPHEVALAQAEMSRFVEQRNKALAMMLQEGRQLAHRPYLFRRPRWMRWRSITDANTSQGGASV